MALARRTRAQREFVPAAWVRDRQLEGDLICSRNKRFNGRQTKMESSFAYLGVAVLRPLESPTAVSAKTMEVVRYVDEVMWWPGRIAPCGTKSFHVLPSKAVCRCKGSGATCARSSLCSPGPPAVASGLPNIASAP